MVNILKYSLENSVMKKIYKKMRHCRCFKSLFLILFIICSSCSDNRVLVEKLCEKQEQTGKCSLGCKNSKTETTFSNFTFKNDTVMYVLENNLTGEKMIHKEKNCKVIDKKNWECESGQMFDGIWSQRYGYYCAK